MRHGVGFEQDTARPESENEVALSVIRDSLLDERVVTIPIETLFAGDSPRLNGESVEHIRVLSEAPVPLPPILVHRGTMRVLDGMHRLRAAQLRGDSEILARYFDGDDHDAFVLAVKANAGHGLPLTLADRTTAAIRIIKSHPQWSDRAIAEVTALSAKTVGGLRQRASEGSPQLHARIGRDGRVRPLDSATGRLKAAEVLVANPDASLREIARIAGISTGTARDVQTRLRQHADPVPAGARRATAGEHRTPKPRPKPAPKPAEDAVPCEPPRIERDSAVQRLQRDPSLRFSETGRTLLRLLDSLRLDPESWEQLAEYLPEHTKPIVESLARECARTWTDFADRIQQPERHKD